LLSSGVLSDQEPGVDQSLQHVGPTSPAGGTRSTIVAARGELHPGDADVFDPLQAVTLGHGYRRCRQPGW
jgi:hypothetical protein